MESLPRKPRSPEQLEAERLRDERWLQQMARGGRAGEAALEQLIDVYEARMLKRAKWHGSLPQPDAEEVVQDLWVRVFKNAGTFRDGAVPFMWMLKILDNLVIDRNRERGKQLRDAEAANDEEALSPAAGAERPLEPDELHRRAALDDCVRGKLSKLVRLFPEDVGNVVLAYWQELTIRQLASHMDKTEGATRVALHAIRLKFRRHFQPCLEWLGPSMPNHDPAGRS